MKCLKKGRSTLCSAGICSRCSCYWLFGDMLQAQYLKSDKEAKTANSHCTLASFQQFSGLLRQKNGDIVTLSLQFSLKCSIFLLLLLKKISRTLSGLCTCCAAPAAVRAHYFNLSVSRGSVCFPGT